MDKAQLATVVVTAVVSVVAKELVTWLISLVRGTSAAATLGSKVKAVFTKRNFEIVVNLVALAFYVGVLVNFAIGESPPTRLEILLIAGSVVAILFVLFNLLLELAKTRVPERKSAP